MRVIGHHIRFRLKEPGVIVRSPTERRMVAQVVLEQGKAIGLLTCDLPDDHGHVEAICNRLEAGRFAQRVESSLKQRLDLTVGFEQYEPKPILDGRHLYNTARYILRQPERHGVDVDPFREASNLPDLLGLRLLGGYTAPSLRSWLPRLRRSELLEWYGLTALEPAEGTVDRVWEAALRATALPTLRVGSPLAIAARCAALEVIGRRLTNAEIASQLEISRRGVTRLRALPAPPALVHAIRLQLGLEAALGARALLDRPY